MKLTAQARALAAPLALAASLSAAMTANDKRRGIAALSAVRLTAADGSLEIAANILDFAITLTVLAVTIEAPGEIAVDGARLAGLVAGFPGDATVTIAMADTVATVGCGRSRFKFPVIRPDQLPAMLALAEETGRLELSRADAIRMLGVPLIAAGDEVTRYYLTGVYLHIVDGVLTAVGTDGTRLIRVVFPGIDGFPAGLIIPRSAIKIALKLLADKAIEKVTLRHSATLCAIKGPNFAFISKLVDGTFPSYAHVIPAFSDNSITVDRKALLAALGRCEIVADKTRDSAIVGLQWSADAPLLRLRLAKEPGIADDAIDGEPSGIGHIAINGRLLAEMIDDLDSEHVRLDPDGVVGPLLITNPDDENYLALLMRCAWVDHHAEGSVDDD